MKKIAAICGSGLGSSFMVEMNIQTALKDLGFNDIEVEHMDLGSAWPGVADLIVCGKDLEDSCKRFGEVLALDNILDKDELKGKLEAWLNG
ncbi:PTS sugar transporter subunit IIB [Alkalibacter saccharofermentans]|uniref:PTS system, ascorbate-specific IIB component n=1 Tax=Alkalibacter saccharofermentans DSM 14828 TaxID=1120975 RepID=A0A1M4ZJ36_9FIRM|nr:PTS sugar transporter subunit IIB [Alkalibacter saccharofermentans]SHF18049.1 PTS system, ascorbate-specific IIB component [Alkalibacter saccharofermentans DSM 14828]